jgi:hypothetical protein
MSPLHARNSLILPLPTCRTVGTILKKPTHRVPLETPSRSGGFSAYCSAMPPDCEDSDQTQTPERTPAYHNGFGPNTDKLGHILRFSQKAVENYTAEVKTLSTGLVGLRGPGGEQAEKILTITKEIAKQVTDFAGGVLVIHEMMPVLFVAIVEAYLKDVLIYAAGIDSSLAQRTGQSATYQEALDAKSLEDLKLKLRSKWARTFVDNGGPTTWIKKFESMGASGYRPETVGQMERLWGIRHLVVHSAGIAKAEFVRGHPELKAQVGKRFIVSSAHFKPWGVAIYNFVEVTDQYFVRRCQESQKLLPNADAPKAPETQGESLHAP